MADSHRCPVSGCPIMVGARMLMCRVHWALVPQALQDAIWAAWDHGRGTGTPAHRAAITRAIAAANERSLLP